MKQDWGLLRCYLSRPSGRRDPGTAYLRSSAGWRSPFRHQNMFVDSYQFFRALTQLTFEPRNGFLLRENQNRALCFLPRIHESRSEEHTSELQSLTNLVCRLLLEKKNIDKILAVVDRRLQDANPASHDTIDPNDRAS